MTGRCGDVRQSLGVYVVGAIDPAERAFVDRHLATCAACRDELAGLAGLPALLGRVAIDEAERVSSADGAAAAPPERLLDTLLAEVARQQRRARRRNAVLGVAASLLILAGAGAGAAMDSAVFSPGGHSQQAAVADWNRVSGHNPATHVTAVVKYRRHSWGTEMDLAVAGLRPGTRCEAWVIDSAGRRVAVGGWQYKEENSWYPGSTAVPIKNISGFEITAHGKALVVVPAA